MTTVAAAAHIKAEREIVPSRTVDAALSLSFSLEPFANRTTLAGSHQEPPLKVVRAFTNEDGSAFVHLHNVSGGVLGGDRLATSVDVGASASVQLTTTGATRVYRPRASVEPAYQRNDFYVSENGMLEYVPDPIIPFSGARYLQRTTIHLADGAGLFWWEILAPGREARGEVFQYESVEMKTDIFAVGRPIASERVRLEPLARNISQLARLGPYRYSATFYICRVGLGGKAWVAAESRLRQLVEDLTIPGELLIGVSTLIEYGIVIRFLAHRGRAVARVLYFLWNAAKTLLCGRIAIPPRKLN